LTELFERGIDYTRWCRRVHGAIARVPEARMLFESSISEPRERLFEVLASPAVRAVADRFESVFAHGNRHLAKAVASRYALDPDEVLCTTGAINAIGMVLRALVTPDDHVLVETPAFDLLAYMAERSGARVERLPRQGEGFGLPPAALRERLQPDTRLVLVSNLHNPSGAALDGMALKALAFEASYVGAWLLVDEVYEDFALDTYGGCAARLAPNIISVNSLSKVHGLFSLRCGWIVADVATITRIADANAQDELSISKLTHAVAAYLLEARPCLDDHWRGVLGRNRPVLTRHVERLTDAGLLEGAVPEHGCMYFPRVVGVDDTWSLAQWLWHQHRLLVAPGEFFGAPGHIRLGFGGADPTLLDDALDRLGTALAAYHGSAAGRKAT
jgi:hypothetical protein